MTMMFDTPQDIAFVKACARKGALSLEIQGMHKRGQTAYSIVKEVYGFRGTRQSVLEDLTEYIEATLRLRKMPEDEYRDCLHRVQEIIDKISGPGFSQAKFEAVIENAEQREIISGGARQAMSDLFYVGVVSQNAGNR